MTAAVPWFDLSDPAFDVTSDVVHRAREESWYVQTPWGWAVLRYEQAVAVLKDRRFQQGNARWPAQNGVHSGPFATWWGETLLSLEGEDHLRLRRLLGPGLPQPGDRGDAAAVPGARGRAGRRVRPARRGRADLRVRRAVRVAHPLRAARPARGALGAGGALGRRPREVVRHQPARRPAPDRGGAGGTHRVRRRRRPRPAREPAGRPRHHARARPQRRDPHRARAVGRAGVPRVRGDGDHPQPDRPRAADAACGTPTSGRCWPSDPSSALPPSRR